METAKTRDGWKILLIVLIYLTGLFIFLVALASAQTREGEENPALSLPNKSGRPPNFLQDFVFVPGSAKLINGRQVLALYKNEEKEFYAVVLFNADCDRTGCTPTELIAFSIVDSEGRDVELANNPAVKGRRITPGI